MSLADFAFPPQQRLRTVSQQLRTLADGPTSALGDFDAAAHGWSDWAATGYSPDRGHGGLQPYQDPYAELMSENAFGPPTPGSHRQASAHAGPGFDVHMAHGGGDDELAQATLDHSFAVQPLGDARAVPPPPAQLEDLRPVETAQSYPGSPARSRASSLQSNHGTSSLHMSVLTSPSSPFFPQPLPSPFHDHRASFSSSTMNPSHSVRSSSPSDSSSVSNLNMSRIETGSATSSVYGGGGGDSGSTAPSTPYRSGSISRQNSQRDASQKHARRRSSPIKTSGRHTRKLSNAERKAICQFHLTHPGWKQDDIGAHFGYERSTISKTLKFKDKYLAMDSEDDASAAAVQAFLHTGQQPPHESGQDNGDSPEATSPEATPVLPSSSTPQPSSGLVASSSTSSLVSLDSTVTSDLAASTSSTASLSASMLSASQYPRIDVALAAWARDHAANGNALSDSVLQRQARSLARGIHGHETFRASQTWLDGFKVRAGIVGGAFLNEQRAPSPLAPALPALCNSQRSLDPPREEEDEGDETAADIPLVRRSKRSIGSKTVRRLASAKSTLAAFAEGFAGRTSSPATASSSSRMETDLAGGSFGDLSLDSEATPTHSTVHSRASTHATERPPQLAQPFSYSPEGIDAGNTPSRASYSVAAVGSFSLGSSVGHVSDYSPPDSASHSLRSSMYAGAYAGGMTQPYSPHDLGASCSSAQDFSASSSRSSLVNYPQQGLYNNASPAPSLQRHRRSGSAASSTSVYSGLTAFSSQNGPGTPLSGSLYGSFRDSQGNLCASVPGTPANPALASSSNSSSQQHGSYFSLEQAQLQNSFLSASASGAGTTPTSQYSTHASSSSSSLASSTQPYQQHSSQPRYPSQQNQPYPQATLDTSQHPPPHQQPGASGATSAADAGLNRRATISGGLPFNSAARNSVPSSAAMTPSSSFGAGSRASVSGQGAGASVTLEQAFSSLEIALEYLSTRAGQDYVSPKDLVVLADLRGKMERARNARGVHMAAISSAPATPSGLGPSSSSSGGGSGGPGFHPAFMPSQVNASFAAAAAANGNLGPAKQQRLRLARTQSTSSVPFFGGSASGTGLGLARRPGSSLSLYEVDGH